MAPLPFLLSCARRESVVARTFRPWSPATKQPLVFVVDLIHVVHIVGVEALAGTAFNFAGDGLQPAERSRKAHTAGIGSAFQARATPSWSCTSNTPKFRITGVVPRTAATLPASTRTCSLRNLGHKSTVRIRTPLAPYTPIHTSKAPSSPLLPSVCSFSFGFPRPVGCR